jgi:queuosine biosynthesis protein QueD
VGIAAKLSAFGKYAKFFAKKPSSSLPLLSLADARKPKYILLVTMELYKEFSFDSAHFLPFVDENHKCRRVHGHTYVVRLYVSGDLDPVLGWVVDFAVIKDVWRPLEEKLDHRLLNDIPGLENPTAENIAIWIWRQVKPQLPKLSQVLVCENASSGVIYKGEFE